MVVGLNGLLRNAGVTACIFVLVGSSATAQSRYDQSLDVFGAGLSSQSDYGGTGSLDFQQFHTSREFGTYSPYVGSAPATTTPTRHRRWGQETGIGSSNSQTTAATADSMPLGNYRPTSQSPGLPLAQQGIGPENPTFSVRMSSPALAPTFNTPSLLRLGSQIRAGSFEGAPPSGLSGRAYWMFGLTGAESPMENRLLAPATSAPEW
jgi:hypothetical protein